MKLYICILIFIMHGLNSICQNTIFIDTTFSNIGAKDLNQQYISKKLTKGIKLQNKYFDNGFIIKDKDTIHCKIYLEKHRLNDDCYLYVIVKLNNDSIVCLSAKNIVCYGVKGYIFKSFCTRYESQQIHFFLKQIESGKISLFAREPIPTDNNFAYYFSIKGNSNMYYIAPYSNNIMIFEQKQNSYLPNDVRLNIMTNQIPEKFKVAFSQLLSDCLIVKNKILTEYYTINDIKAMINEYNFCGQ